ncbi:hypothetical protein RchiOBHm_Chr3g0494691 [Rosa chinensis]|uniref:Uncharacterized protein n=1 Tax=Rosa chinensis TaxID=74649 RepID=A0A2P6RH24_ROSCH|nr:hypothetical protein RchiOBHm_Chr3g0494691 [Rosa chinensis]
MPAPEKSCEAKPPSFWSGRRGKAGKQSRLSPAGAPDVSPPVFGTSPQKQVHPSAPVSRSVPASSPLPHVVFAHVLPPSKSESDSSHSYTGQSPGPSPSTLIAAASAALLPCVQWALSLFLALVLLYNSRG